MGESSRTVRVRFARAGSASVLQDHIGRTQRSQPSPARPLGAYVGQWLGEDGGLDRVSRRHAGCVRHEVSRASPARADIMVPIDEPAPPGTAPGYENLSD